MRRNIVVNAAKFRSNFEADHYRQVAKKYKRTHSMTHISAVGLSSLSAGLSSATLATALTGFGIVASPVQTKESVILNSRSSFVKCKNTTNSRLQSGMALKIRRQKTKKHKLQILTN